MRKIFILTACVLVSGCATYWHDTEAKFVPFGFDALMSLPGDASVFVADDGQVWAYTIADKKKAVAWGGSAVRGIGQVATQVTGPGGMSLSNTGGVDGVVKTPNTVQDMGSALSKVVGPGGISGIVTTVGESRKAAATPTPQPAPVVLGIP